jgi:DNA-binding NtrC family response regulator
MGQATSPIALVVEDDRWQRELVVVLLEESEMDVIQCDNAEAALDMLERFGQGIVMIFTDVNLAGAIDGVELAHVAAARHPDVHVTVTSGTGLRRPLPDGVTFLPKPWLALDVLREAERSVHH